ncbi:hypothetical protein C799_02893 [Bacteroides thetaiotaomicron dnLKV9]|uniref:phospholipase D n=1 Tax=Bacteroides thetaiotaomicron dnLKV9 TaxID=1235785 RepID=R9HIP7_BACT4|nr:phospholipase D-like domain-containing protein [Bacteroides thetaiotaomicron]EOS01040.1 hypothetical protein C799_02893 [Bacteroides thetaiotaomicron dnLKV9]
MCNFTNEVPENMDEISQRLKLYIDKSYNKPDKSKIQKIVSNFKLSLVKTGQWGKRWGYAEATAIITIPSDVLDIIDSNIKKSLCFIIDTILQATNCGLEIISLDFIPGNIIQAEDDIPELEVLFEKQKNKIIREINEAKFSIWIAVAWFTLDDIYELLIQKRKEGLNIRIIIIEDNINQSKYDKYKSDLNILCYPKFGAYNENLMHNKFCIIDLEKVIHGSYNWSKKAEYNRETVEVVKNRKTAEDFAEQFKKLYLDIINSKQ